jgi:hypothetical protein
MAAVGDDEKWSLCVFSFASVHAAVTWVVAEMAPHVDLTGLDDVFGTFMRDNVFRRRHQSFAELIELARQLRVFYPSFLFSGHTWESTVWIREEDNGSILCVHLPNFRFYVRGTPLGTPYAGPWHGEETRWFSISDEYTAQFPQMTNFFKQNYERAWFMCNPAASAADFEFTPKEGSDLMPIRICFRQGNHVIKNPNRIPL